MTQQDDITQRVLTDDELMALLPGAVRLPPGWKDTARAIESAVLSKLRAPVADAPVCQRCGGTGEADSGGIHPWGAPALIPCECTVSAPVADERAQNIHSLISRFRNATRDDAKNGGRAYFEAARAIEDELRQAVDALASAPVAGEAQPLGYVMKGREWPDQCYYPSSHKPTDIHNWTPVFDHAAPQASAEPVQEVAGVTLDGCLETLFRVGEHLGINYAESRKQPGAPSGVYIKAIEDRISQASNAAREEAAKLMDQTSRSSGAELIRALKQPQAGKDGGQQRAAFDHPVFAFLLGEGPLHGVHFGDRHPSERGAYWWRKDLRAALSAPQA